jgi:tRNA (cmo5U34)-methyltransferase
MTDENTWTESASQLFLGFDRVVTPSREEIRDVLLDLVPAATDDSFLAAEIGVGGGWLSEALLRRFSAARVVGLDGSSTMLDRTASVLEPFAGRWELRPFRLEDNSWIGDLRGQVRCFLSSLVIHHLHGPDKRVLYRELGNRLEPGGALLISDLVAPNSDRERRYLARAWDDVVRQQSLELTGKLDAYRLFQEEHWNWFEYPDPMDRPSTVPEHLLWLTEAGFVGVNVFWERAGHAIYGGFRPQ